jgi:plasmid stabilization system protein ParE
MARAVWTPLAELEFEEILFYIRVIDGRPEIARRIGEELRECVDRHAQSPALGHKHPLAPDGWLYAKYKRWLIFYQSHPDGIEVMRVVDAVRDLPSVLRK